MPIEPTAGPLARGVELLAAGDLDGAERALASALAAGDGVAAAMRGLARIAVERGAGAAAIDWFERVMAEDPADAATGVELARLLSQSGRGEDARDTLLVAVHHRPDHAEAWHQLGLLDVAAGRFDEAAEHFGTAAAAAPSRPDARIELARLAVRRTRWEDAVAHYRSALALGPCSAQVYGELANALIPLQRNAEALEIFAGLRAQYPWSNVPRIGYANVLLQVGRFDEALAEYDAALEGEPNNYFARWHRSQLLLMRHRFAEGWPGYESRLLGQVENLPRPFPLPRWRGEPLDGKSILVYGEQGVGDEIMFASCFADLIARARRVVIECRPKLQRLFARSFPAASILVTEGVPIEQTLTALEGVDCHVPAGSLPPHFRLAADRFPGTPYLRADPARVAHWRAALASLGPGLKVGISWRGGSVRTRRDARSVPLVGWSPVLDLPGCRFVSLQYDAAAGDFAAVGDRVTHWSEAIDDYDETAALVAALDVVVTVCTSLVHLSGALGQRTWVLVPTVPEWRYGLSGSRMPWYASAELERQGPAEDWPAVLGRIAHRLVGLAS